MTRGTRNKCPVLGINAALGALRPKVGLNIEEDIEYIDTFA